MFKQTYQIDRCVCEGKPFRDLVEIARVHDLDIRALADREGCGTHCGLCVAYLRRALATGQVVFEELLPKEPL